MNTADALVLVPAQFNAAGPMPSASTTERIIVVSNPGTYGAIGDLYWDNGGGSGGLEKLPRSQSRLIFISSPTDLVGAGSPPLTFLSHRFYFWDGTAWQLI